MARSSSPELAPDAFRLLVAGVEDYAIFMLDVDGHVLTWNRGAETIKGYAADEIVGHHFSAFYTPDDLAAHKPDNELATATREGRVEDEGWRVRKDGSRFWANVVISAVRTEQGNLLGFAKVTRDLTERRAAAEALRRSEERFRLLVDGIHDYAIYMLDPDGRVATWNVGAERIKGYTPTEIIGHRYAVFFLPEDIAAGKPDAELRAARETGRYEEEGFRVRKDGTRFWAGVVVTAVYDATGELVGFAKVTRDLTSRIEAERNERQLAAERAARAVAEEAENVLREERERYRTLSRRLEVILEGIADGITVQDQTGALLFANSTAAHVCGFASAKELLAAPPGEVVGRFDMLDEAGKPFDPQKLPGRRVFAGEKTASALMRVRERATGKEWWSAIRSSLAIDDAGTRGLAVNVWHDVSADRRREEHERYLASATAALSSSLDYQSMLRSLAGLLVPGLSDWCSIHLLEGDELRNVVVTHVDPARIAQAREFAALYPPDPSQKQGVWQVLRTGQSEILEDIPDELLVRGARDARHLSILRAVGMRSLVIVPIRIRDHVCGTITLVSAESNRRFQREDVALGEELGRRAGIAIENTRLYAAEKRARERLELVARAGEAFASTLDYESTLRSVVAIVLPSLADFAFFDVTEGADVRRVAAAYDDPASDALVKSAAWARSAREDTNVSALFTGKTGVHVGIDDAWMQNVARSPEHLELLRRLELRSMITVPIFGHGSLLGALSVCFGKSGRSHAADDASLVEEIARRAGIAIVQARLFSEARAAAKAAEDASRLKDEFLATVSHELRTPLNAIVGWSSLLRGKNANPELAKGLDVIQRNALSQGKIIDDILDVSRIITGKLRLELEPTDLTLVVEEAIEVVRPSANAKNLTIVFEGGREPLLLVADPSRLQQIVWNLLSNAVKFTDAGGTVTASVVRDGPELVLTVTDSGCGIGADFLPYVFDRFHQADGTTTRRVGGLGLGLAIVRHLTELHGGHVAAESAGAGKGSSFCVRLPLGIGAPNVAEEGAVASQPMPTVRGLAASLAGLHVLVVDDEVDARELVTTLLEVAGAQVSAAESAARALDLFAATIPDVVVSDIGMPGEDGFALVRRIRALAPDAGANVPAIALTAYARSEDRTRALRAGFTTHLAKPVSPDELVAAVAGVAKLTAKPPPA